jgi:hypothetical protein
MVDCCVSRKPSSLQRIYKPVDSDYSCLKCAELESHLEETCKKLSPSQLIIKLLYKEINDIATEKMPKPSNTISDCETGVDVASPNKWSSIASKRPYNKNKARNSHIYQITQPIKYANRLTFQKLLLAVMEMWRLKLRKQLNFPQITT